MRGSGRESVNIYIYIYIYVATTYTRVCCFYDVLLLRRIAEASMGCLVEKARVRCPASSPVRSRRHGCESFEKGASRELMIAFVRRGHLNAQEVECSV